MALFYVDAVRKTQPHGPYLFFGYSLGGLVALEMARILSSRGEATSLLVMIDSYPHITTLPLGQQLQLLEIRARTRILTALRGQGIHRGGTTMDRAQAAAFAPALEHVTDCAYAALQRYRPAFYPGNVKFVRARQLSNFPKDPFATWSHVIPNLEVETVPGDHLGMLTTRFRTLGAVLTKYLLRPDSPGN